MDQSRERQYDEAAAEALDKAQCLAEDSLRLVWLGTDSTQYLKYVKLDEGVWLYGFVGQWVCASELRCFLSAAEGLLRAKPLLQQWLMASQGIDQADADKTVDGFATRLPSLLHHAEAVSPAMSRHLKKHTNQPSKKILLILHFNRTSIFISSNPTAEDMGHLHNFMSNHIPITQNISLTTTREQLSRDERFYCDLRGNVVQMAHTVASHTILQVMQKVKEVREREKPMTAWEVHVMGGGINMIQAVGGDALRKAWSFAWQLEFGEDLAADARKSMRHPAAQQATADELIAIGEVDTEFDFLADELKAMIVPAGSKDIFEF